MNKQRARQAFAVENDAREGLAITSAAGHEAMGESVRPLRLY